MSINSEFNSPYSVHKIFHHWDKISELREGKQPIPLQVQLIMSDLCNQDCHFCSYRNSNYTTNELFKVIDKDGKVNNNPNRMIPYEKCIEILDDCKELGVKGMQFTGGGEPTVHPKHQEIMQHSVNLGLELGLVSNMVILRDGLLDVFKSDKSKWVRVSVDAGDELSYARIRRINKAMYNKACENIQKLVHIRDSFNPDLVIGVGFVVTKENWQEVVIATEKAKSWGVNNIRISAIFSEDDIDYFDGFWEEANELCKEAKKLEDPKQNFKVFNLFDDRSEDLKLGHPDYSFCTYQHLNSYIGGDLNVYRCCNLAYNLRGKLGSIENMRFKDFWLSREKEDVMGDFDARGCPLCMFSNKNRLALYAIESNPKHVNFV